MFNGFDAVFDEHSKVLILGSFPSVKSREQGFYYGNKQNRFWKMLESVFNQKIEDDINFKKDFLLKKHIALYDVICESDITGSADAVLEKSNNKLSSIDFLLPPNTCVKKIICNGKTAYKLLMKFYHGSIPVISLPSTSSANPNFNPNLWQDELKFLK